MQAIAILGAGSWGTALGLYLARKGQRVNIWSIDSSEIDAMISEGANNRYLPQILLPPSLKPHHDLKDTIANVDEIIIAIPSVGIRTTFHSLKPLIKPTQKLICVSKGMDAQSGKFFNELAEEFFPKHSFAVLSGPSFAKEVANGMPCAVMIASEDQNLLQALQQRFQSDIFHCYLTDDVIGVEIGGIVKNVIAIATGIADGLALGASFRSALITLGLQEMIMLAKSLGAKEKTLIHVSGLGDLMLTCSDNLSRNRRFGLQLAQETNAKDAEKKIGQAIEGKENAKLIVQLAQKNKITLPICETVLKILENKISPQDGVKLFFQ